MLVLLFHFGSILVPCWFYCSILVLCLFHELIPTLIGVPPNGIFYPWARWDRGLADFRRCSRDGACVFFVFLRFSLGTRAGAGDARGRHSFMRLWNRNPTSSQKSYEFTEILRVHRNPTNSQKSNEFTEILRVQRNPTSSEKSYEFTDILRVHRNPTSSQKSYEFREILWVHRHPTSSEKSYEFTDILRVQRNPTTSQKS